MGDLFQRAQQFIGTGFTLHLWNGFVAFAAVMVIGFFLKYFLHTVGRKLIAKGIAQLVVQLSSPNTNVSPKNN
jgi:hypothetical protein